MHQALDWIALSFASGLGLKGYWRLLEVYDSPTEVLNADCQSRKKLSGLRDNQLAGLVDCERLRSRAELELSRLAKGRAFAISYVCPDYPPLLKEISDPPPVIYLRGDPALLNLPNIAIVGSRSATSYGLRVAYNLAKELAGNKVSVCSGLALGIDTEAHTGTLAGGGKTIAVLGCGLDIVYPRQNNKLYQDIVQSGAVVTEYPLGTKPEGFRFPARNRIIAGLSQGVVVVEAARKSGSLITAQLGLDFGRDIFAVPGQVDSGKSEGAHWLLKQGAKLVQDAEDILEELWPGYQMEEKSADVTNVNLTIEAKAILGYLDVYPLARQELIDRSAMSAEQVSSILLMLELDDLVEILPGDMIRLI